jgi:mRNA interferase HicA
MKLDALLRHLRRNGCILRREGREHAIWENPQTGHGEAVPRRNEISNVLAKRICRKLSIPDPQGWCDLAFLYEGWSIEERT